MKRISDFTQFGLSHEEQRSVKGGNAPSPPCTAVLFVRNRVGYPQGTTVIVYLFDCGDELTNISIGAEVVSCTCRTW